MTDTKQTETLKLVAVERGFYENRLIEPGVKFLFTPTKTEKNGEPKLPKWAQRADKPLPASKKPAGDLKPVAAQAAVATKRGQLANGGQTESLA